jgi:hypothetical protein
MATLILPFPELKTLEALDTAAKEGMAREPAVTLYWSGDSVVLEYSSVALPADAL